MSAYAPWSEDVALSVIAPHRDAPGALLPMLHAVQEAFGFIPDEAVALLADVLNLSRAEVHGVISFYHDFRRSRPGRHVVKVCRAEACQAVGAEGLLDHVRRTLQVDEGGPPSPDGAFSLQVAYCLGNCALGPAVMIDETLHGRVTPARFKALADGLRDREDAA
jgi:formate dehydrogenase subunit gamma